MFTVIFVTIITTIAIFFPPSLGKIFLIFQNLTQKKLSWTFKTVSFFSAIITRFISIFINKIILLLSECHTPVQTCLLPPKFLKNKCPFSICSLELMHNLCIRDPQGHPHGQQFTRGLTGLSIQLSHGYDLLQRKHSKQNSKGKRCMGQRPEETKFRRWVRLGCPGSAVVRTPCSQCRGMSLTPGWRTKTPHATQCAGGRKKRVLSLWSHPGHAFFPSSMKLW